MDWQAIITNLGITGAGVGIAGYVLKRWLVHTMAKDGASADARTIQHETILFLRGEMKERDRMASERYEQLRREYLEFKLGVEREHRVFRTVSQAAVRDIRKINDGRIPEEQLDTVIYQSGMGPLDP